MANLPPKRLAMAAGGLMFAWLVGIAMTAQQPQLSEQAFKNVQVLRGIPVDEFMGTMGLFSAALSMCCGDCHTGAGTSSPKWEDDPPRKRTARSMIQMVNTLNRTSFNGRQVVTCWTCHRGQPRPAATPALDRIYGEPVLEPADILPAATSGVPTVGQILEAFDLVSDTVEPAHRVECCATPAGRHPVAVVGAQERERDEARGGVRHREQDEID